MNNSLGPDHREVGDSHRIQGINMNYTAIVKEQDNCWVGWIEEVPGVNCQESTREELLESLTVTLREALEFNQTTHLSSPH